MAGSEISKYATELSAALVQAGVSPADLSSIATAAANLANLADTAPKQIPKSEWDQGVDQWQQARDAFAGKLAEALLGPLAVVPGLGALTSDLGKLGSEGIHGGLDLGPVHLEVASSVLVVQPAEFRDIPGTPPPQAIGPYQVNQIAANLSSPFGGGLPGGGSLVRLPAAGGYGGTLELPLGPVQVSATAVMAVVEGQPSFLAILGAQFLPPIQLSFGFSLDRVGGIVGVNRRADSEALRDAVRSGTVGDVLFAVSPPPRPGDLVSAADRLFPAQLGTHLIGPSLKLSWLSFGPEGSLLGLDLAVIVEIPSGKVALLGVARAGIPALPLLINLRLDVVGLVDPVERLVSIDASLADSHVLGVFEVYGDAAMRFSWGTTGYFIASVGGLYPGFNPEPARIPALRRVGLVMDNPVPIIEIRSEGYFAVTSNSIQFGGRLDIGISLGIEAHGFVQLDAIVQFRPFHFDARIAAGFDVSVDGFSFASVGLEGSISGPGPIVIRGSLSIDVFLFSLSWDESFTLGSGPADTPPPAGDLLFLMAEELGRTENVQAESIADSQVVLRPRPVAATAAAVPPTGTLQVAQRRAPLGLKIDRLDGRPLGPPRGVSLMGGSRDVLERFSPGSYITLSDAEALNRPPFDLLPSGRVLSLSDPALAANSTDETRTVEQIVIVGQAIVSDPDPPLGAWLDLRGVTALVAAAGRPPALSDPSPLIAAKREAWTATGSTELFTSATAAHQYVRYSSGVALASTDAAAALDLVGV